jgi:hypothetical protein
MDEETIERRVYRSELSRLTGWGATWIRTLEKTGKIPGAALIVGENANGGLEARAMAIVAGQATGTDRRGSK